MHLLKRNRNKTSLPVTEYPVQESFEIAGRKYFEFVDTSNMPAGRFLAALKYYIPLKTNCDETFMKYFVKAMDSVLSDPKQISIEKMINLKNMVKDRTEFIFTPELVMKYASVVYMAENESPYTYDEVFGEEKISFWKANASAEDFFLSQPILKLLPQLRSAGGYVQSYSTMVREAQVQHLIKISEILSPHQKWADDVTNISLLITQLRKQTGFVGNQSMNISSTSTSNTLSSKNKSSNGKN